MQYHLASLNLSSFQSTFRDALRPETLRSKADRVLTNVLRQNRVPTVVKDAGHASFLETPIGLATLVIMRCLECLSHPRYSGDENALSNLRRYWKASVNLLAGTIQKIPSVDAWLDRDPSGEHANRQAGAADDGCKVLYGRAGFLYTLLRVRKTLAEATKLKWYNELERSQREEVEVLVSDASLEVVVGSITKRGKLGARSYARSVAIEPNVERNIPSLPPLMWSWHGRRYLGGVHGVKSGDERSQRHHGQEHINELVQWCHGAPGAVILLSTMIRLQSTEHSYFKLDDDLKSQLRTSIQQGADVIYERGLLRKGLGSESLTKQKWIVHIRKGTKPA
ncbi:hypothetical protein FA15DRAFT_704324 [Coprinopsis marcescibilis]|uniref:Uncharacterized protein n=1 Tax=Coprinopsis marcescibilis TaxID=230819 RepID=A0A5C3KVU6_COPMA|nr:hypothetical protein FA15DRAFT_704324 [Coprinopsis marcescibilis]